MDAATLAAKTRYGYKKSAAVVGRTVSKYRPTTAANPLTTAYGTALAAFDTVPQFTFVNPQKPGVVIYYALIDATGMQVGDYLHGSDDPYFVATLDDVAAPMVIRCNAVLTLTRTARNLIAGANDYGASSSTTDAVILSAWPGSLIMQGRGERNEIGLPGDIKLGWWRAMLPVSIPATPRPSDIITDSVTGARVIISTAERTSMGWRILAAQQAA